MQVSSEQIPSSSASPTKEAFLADLQEFWVKQGSVTLNMNKIPMFGGTQLDLYKLYNTVTAKGGAKVVSEQKIWKSVINEFEFPSTCTSAAYTIRNHYIRFLLAYEHKNYFKKNPEEGLPEIPVGRKGKRYIQQQSTETSQSESTTQQQQPTTTTTTTTAIAPTQSTAAPTKTKQRKVNLSDTSTEQEEYEPKPRKIPIRYTRSITAAAAASRKRSNSPRDSEISFQDLLENDNSNKSATTTATSQTDSLPKSANKKSKIKQEQSLQSDSNTAQTSKTEKQQSDFDMFTLAVSSQTANTNITNNNNNNNNNNNSSTNSNSNTCINEMSEMDSTRNSEQHLQNLNSPEQQHKQQSHSLQEKQKSQPDTLEIETTQKVDTLLIQSKQENLEIQEEIQVTSKYDPTESMLLRITAAFSSGNQEEIGFALDSLFLSTTNSLQPYPIDRNQFLLPGIVHYLQFCISNLQSSSSVGTTSDTYLQPPAINQNDSNNRIISQQQQDINNQNPAKQNQQQNKDYRTAMKIAFLQEQIRIILRIFRNISSQSIPNASFLCKYQPFLTSIIQLFIYKFDAISFEICLEILVSISVDIRLMEIQHKNEFCCNILSLLHSEKEQHILSALTILCKLLEIEENESIIEAFLPMFIDEIPRILHLLTGALRKRMLKFICYLTNRRVTSRLTLAQKPNIIPSLIQLLINLSYTNQLVQSDAMASRTALLTATALRNLSLTSISFSIFQPFEKHLQYLAQSTENEIRDIMFSITAGYFKLKADLFEKQSYFQQNFNSPAFN